ncbi:MAG: acyltransferase [Bacteroidota bacterium]|nr:acyltransferase [Bacteroidota bacterium]
MDQRSRHWFFHQDHKPHHEPSLDGLRGIAVILVLLSHASNNDFFFWDGLTFYGIGKGGVYLFFTLSAFLLDRQIVHALSQGIANSSFWQRYFLRRVLRILPLLLVSLVIFYYLSRIGVSSPIEYLQDIVRHFFLMDGRSIYWSVPVEFKYYLISPLLLVLCQKAFYWNLKKIGLLFTILVLIALAYDLLIGFHKLNTLKYLVVFLSGTYIAIGTYHSQFPSIKKTIAGALGFSALIICLMANPYYVDELLGISPTNNGRQMLIVYSFLCLIMLSAALYDNNAFKSFLQMKWLRFIGIISYSVYLFHMPVIEILKKDFILIPSELKIYVYLIITIMVSTITYLCIEKPLSRLMLRKQTAPSGANSLP